MIVGYSRTFGGVTPVDITIPAGTTFAGSETDLAAYTFSSLSFGADEAGRAIIAVVAGSDSAGGAEVLSVTIGGQVAALAVPARNNSGVTSGNVEIYIAEPFGTSGSVVVNWGQTMQRCGVQVYRMTGHGSLVPHDTAVVETNTDPHAVTLDIPANGAALGGTTNNTASSAVTWSGLTEDVDADFVTNTRLSTAHDEFAAGQAGQAISADLISAGPTRRASAFASWAP